MPMSRTEEPGPDGRVFLFSGHLIDRPERPTPRFPPRLGPEVSEAIVTLLSHLDGGDGDLAICGGACGGDLLFARAALDRNIPLEIRLARPPGDFLESSVAFAGQDWVDLFHLVCGHRRTTVFPPTAGAGANVYEQTNAQMLERALTWGASRLHFLCLWNRRPGQKGGTHGMVERVRDRGGEIHIIDPTDLPDSSVSE